MNAPDDEDGVPFSDVHEFAPEKKIVRVLVVKPNGHFMFEFPLSRSEDGKLLIVVESLSTHDGQIPFLTVEALA